VGSDVTSYNYSSRGELVSVTLPDTTLIEYVHDPLGRRIAKKVDGTVVAKYLWQGLTRLLAVYDGSDNLVMRFLYADGRMPVAVEKGIDTYYLTYDQVGSLRVVADSTGGVVKRIDYDSFGNIINDTNASLGIPFGFAGGLHDRDTGLVRFGFRDYDPDTSRWTAKDPILFAGGNIDLYGYCLNDPVNLVDPRGLVVEADAFSAATTYSVGQIYGAAGVLIGTGGAVFVFGVNIAATGTPISIVGGGIVTIVGGAIVVTGAGLFYLATIAHSVANQQTTINQQNIDDPCSGEGSRPMSFWGVGADLNY